jgi:hypothetical protein
MIGLAMVGALVAIGGSLAAVVGRDRRLVVLGLLTAMVAAPLASSPEPGYLTVVFRLLGAVLAAYLLWTATRSRSIDSEGTGIGVIAEFAVAAAAFCVGWFAIPVKPLAGPLAAQAAGFALVGLAIVPLTSRNVLRAGTAVAILALGLNLLLVAWIGPASSLQQIVTAALLVGVAGATSLLMAPAEESGVAAYGYDDSDYELEIEPGEDEIEVPEEPTPSLPDPEPAGRARRLGVRESRR